MDSNDSLERLSKEEGRKLKELLDQQLDIYDPRKDKELKINCKQRTKEFYSKGILKIIARFNKQNIPTPNILNLILKSINNLGGEVRLKDSNMLEVIVVNNEDLECEYLKVFKHYERFFENKLVVEYRGRYFERWERELDRL